MSSRRGLADALRPLEAYGGQVGEKCIQLVIDDSSLVPALAEVHVCTLPFRKSLRYYFASHYAGNSQFLSSYSLKSPQLQAGRILTKFL